MASKSDIRKGTKGTSKNKGVVVKSSNGRTFSIMGLTSAAGDKWVRVKCGDDVAYAPYREFGGLGQDAVRRLNIAGLVLIGTDIAAVRNAVATLKHFPAKSLVEHPGHSGNHFAMPDGTVYSPSGSDTPIVLFTPDTRKCGRSGKRKSWFKSVAKAVQGQSLYEFAFSAMFVPPLLQLSNRAGNIGFELVGDAGVGKSTLQYLMATVAGPGVPNSSGHYWIDCNATANALEHTMATYADQPLIMDEAALFHGSVDGGARATQWKELVFRLTSGTTKGRYSAHTQAEYRFLFFLSSNMSLSDVLGYRHQAELQALQDRLITLRLRDEDRKFGTFDFLPDEYANATAYADALKQAAAQHYGHAYPKFLRKLAQARSDNPKVIRKTIKASLEQFRSATNVDLDDGSDTRVVDAFGLVYAAGMLAQRFKVLPMTYDVLRSTISVYSNYRRERERGLLLRLPERLIDLSEQAGVIDLDVRVPELSGVEMAGPRIFLRTKKGVREILFNEASKARYFPDFRELKLDPDNSQWMIFDEGRDTARRTVRKGHKKEPMVCFRLPPNE